MFPIRGELLDFFIKTLEIENINDADRKRYQRFILEEHIITALTKHINFHPAA